MAEAPINQWVPEYVRGLIPYVPGKPIEETRRQYGLKQVIKLASNENPLGPSPKAMEALRGMLSETNRYPDGAAFALKRALAAHLSVDAEALCVGNGSNELIDMLVRTYCVPGDSIVTSQAAFIAYRLCAQIHGVRTHEAPVDSRLRFDPQAVLELVRGDERARLVVLANPNNPTGSHLNREELHGLLGELSRVRGGAVLVVLDYAYWEYVKDPGLPEPLGVQRAFPDNVLVLRTFSKVYGLAGLRLGYGIASPSVLRMVERVRQPFNVSSLAMVAGEAALGDRQFVAESIRVNTQGMAFWKDALDRMGVPFWESQGNFLLANVQARAGKTGPEVQEACLKQGVIFRPVANYGLPGALRVSIGTAEENRLAAQALARAVGAQPGEIR